MSQFDPSTTLSAEFGIFGVPTQEEKSELILIPVPWDVTTSYGSGASDGPRLIREESTQIDLYDLEYQNAWELGYHMRPISSTILEKNKKYKALAQGVIQRTTAQKGDSLQTQKWIEDINVACGEMCDWVHKQSQEVLREKKRLGLVGGDHSTPLGAIRAVSEELKGDFSVLHIDAHADLRRAYQGFTHSHASIMYNVMNLPDPPRKLVQVGIRDFCQEEYEFIQRHQSIKTFFDYDLKRDLFSGYNWRSISENIITELSDQVYISFDIDGLDPRFCPNTGTPVPGGLTTDQVFFLFSCLKESGRKIVGFDLNEVSSGGLPLAESQWDGNVGARILFKLCGLSVTSPRFY